jgi:hypothetical protein
MAQSYLRMRILLLVFVGVAHLCAQGPDSAKDAKLATPASNEMKLLEGATALARTMTSWALVMIGGSILAVLGTGYYRPASLVVRCAYLAFIPAWSMLSASIYAGTR